MIISKIAILHDWYSVTTDTVMSDGSLRSDSCMALIGNELCSHEQRGFIRTGGLLRIKLGHRSLAAVKALAVGESVQL